jgi:hypothetical protein
MLLLVNSFVGGTNACFLWYDCRNRTVMLASDAAAWSTPVPLGTPAALENSQCRLNVAGSFASGSGTDLDVTVDVTFNAAFSGAKSLYMYIDNRMGLTSGWRQLAARGGTPQISGAALSS